MATVESPTSQDRTPPEAGSPTPVDIATVREHTSRSSQVVTLLAVRRPAARAAARRSGCSGASRSHGSTSPLFATLLRPLRPSARRRLPPLLHPPRLRDDAGPCAATFAILGSHDDAGPGHAVGHRPPQAPRALRPGRATRTPRTSATAPAPGAPSRASSTRTSAGSSTSGWSAASRYGKDLYDDRSCGAIDRALLRSGSSLTLRRSRSRSATSSAGSTSALGLEALVWGGLIRIFAYQHATFSRELDLPHVRPAGLPLPRREPQQLARRARSPSARAGTTTTTRSRPRPGTGSTASSSTSPGGRSGRSSARARLERARAGRRSARPSPPRLRRLRRRPAPRRSGRAARPRARPRRATAAAAAARPKDVAPLRRAAPRGISR